jgi:AAA ATPase domain
VPADQREELPQIGVRHDDDLAAQRHDGKAADPGGVHSVGLVIATLAVENYRSLRRLVVPLAQLTVVTGANGAGKSSLYRALRLLADAARNGAVAALAREGGDVDAVGGPGDDRAAGAGRHLPRAGRGPVQAGLAAARFRRG